MKKSKWIIVTTKKDKVFFAIVDCVIVGILLLPAWLIH